MINKILALAFVLFLFNPVYSQKPTVSYVNPFIGTEKMGHTFPGATVPFGMVQLSPETDTVPYSTGKGYIKDVYKYCAGYQYTDSTIVGFSHTHFSGTGHSDLGDFLLMPTTGNLKLNPGTAENPSSGYRSRFSHQSEKAEPGYYSVHLLDYDVHAELTTSERVGFHQYTLQGNEPFHLILDMSAGIYNYPGKNIWSFVRVENDTLITGYRQTRGWARTRLIYFAMSFSRPITNYGHKSNDEIIYRGFYRKFDETKQFPEMAGHHIAAWFDFDLNQHDTLKVKMALSPVSTAGAMNNLRAEIPHWDFDQVRREASDKWQKELDKITIEADSSTKVNFYTAMYHAFMSPNLYMDTDGKYRGLDQNIHAAVNFTNYTTFSLWDTYRALHPLFTVLQQQRTNDMIASMLAHRQQSVHGILPVWSHHANENWCMIGYHAVAVIADAWMKGIRGFDGHKALEAMVSSASYTPYDGIGDYMKMGYVPADLHSNAASKTLEYAYDDWCIAQMAASVNENELHKNFAKRATSYQHIFDPLSRFMRPRLSDGTFKPAFDPLVTEGQGFIEGNAWNYSLYVPHDPYSLISWHGGNEPFVAHLDSLFTMQLEDEHIEASEDISHDGIIGNYVHGNEPSHHIPYLFVYAGAPWKTQERVRQIMETLYKPFTDGLPGNDDCGQMSAWYIFSALGFYPVCPGSNEYVLGSPTIEFAEISLENGRKFQVEVINQGNGHVYVDQVILNGKPYEKLYLTHETIMQGGRITFVMTDKAVKKIYPDSSLPFSLGIKEPSKE